MPHLKHIDHVAGTMTTKITFVDLAGSERLKRTVGFARTLICARRGASDLSILVHNQTVELSIIIDAIPMAGRGGGEKERRHLNQYR